MTIKGLPLGYTQHWERLRYETRKGGRKQPGESSGILFGPARSGKGTDVIVPMLLDYEGSVICFDPKGQNACITAAHRQRRLKQNVVLLNPFEQWPEFLGQFTHAGVNPIASLDPRSFGFGSDCDALAEGLVIKNPNDRDSHFTESAQQTVSGAIMFIRKYAQESKRNLVSVYELISSAGFFDFARDAVRKGDPLISGRLGRFAGATPDNRELMGVLSTAITNLRFIGNEAMIRSLSGAQKGSVPFNWKELRNRPTTVYVILPVRYLMPMARWLRICIASALTELLVEERRGLPVFLLMDEFAALGHLSIIEATMSLSAGMGLTMLPVLQDVGQLKELYGEGRMQSFMSMAGFQMFLPPRDMMSAEMVSGVSGQKEVIVRSRSVNIDRQTGEPLVTDSASQHARKVLLPDEVMGLGRDELLLRVEGVPDIIHAKRRPYYASHEYRGLWSPDPYHITATRR